MKTRLDYIDRMKGFAILLMVLGHVYLFSLHVAGGVVNRFISSCHMYIFMFMSGYVAYVADAGTLRRKLQKRLPTYILPAFALKWAMFPIAVFMGVARWDEFAGRALTGGYWYLKCLFIFCLLQYPVLKCRRLRYELAFILAVYVLFLVCWKMFPKIATEQYIPLEHCSCFYPSFVLGYYFRKYNLMPRLASSNTLFTVALVGYVYLFFADIQGPVVGNLLNRYLRPTLAIIFITGLFLRQEGKTSRFLDWLAYFGRNSLDVYLFNGVFVLSYTIMDMTVVKDWTYANGMPMLTLLVGIAVSVIIAYCCVWIGKLLHCSKILDLCIYGKRQQ